MANNGISAQSSTSTPLGISGTWSGQATDVSRYGTITTFVDTDVDGALHVEFSSDGVNWDRHKDLDVEVASQTGFVSSFSVIAAYFRIRYVNGVTAQAHLRVQTLLHEDKSNIISTSPNQTIGHSDTVILQRSANDFSLDVQRGLDRDKETVHKFGYNEAVPNGTYADIWSYGVTDASYNWATTDETFRVKAGGNANDTSAGTGARTIHIAYLDGNGIETHEDLTLAGASASAVTSSTGRRVLRSYVKTTGTILSSNTGDILIENSSTGLIVATIDAGVGQTEMSMYTVPANHTAYLLGVGFDVQAGTNKDADIHMWQRTNAYTTTAPFGAKRLIKEWIGVQGDFDHKFDSYPKFDEYTDIWFEAKGNGAVTAVSVDYDLILVHNEDLTSPQA